MKNLFFLLLFFCFLGTISAQDTVTRGNHNYRRGWSLQIGAAEGYGTFRDMGTAPVSFNGLVLQPTLGLHFIFPKRMEFSVVSRNGLGFFEDAVKPALNFSSLDIYSLLRFKFIKAFCSTGHRSLFTKYWGVALSNFLDVTVNPNYENAAAGISDFFGPEAVGRIDFEPRWVVPILFHGEMAIMPIAGVLRPGYSYIDNYTSANSVANTILSDFEVNIKPFAAVSTDIGIDIVTGPASRISFSYLWCYHSSGNSGAHRFDHATHLLCIDFLIKLRTR